jgi:hypothetical protein
VNCDPSFVHLLFIIALAVQYQLWYDFRAHRRLAGSKDKQAAGSAHGAVPHGSSHLAPFLPQRQPATVDHFRQLLKQREQQQAGAERSDGTEKDNSSGDSGQGNSTKFDMKAAMKGAQVSEQVRQG